MRKLSLPLAFFFIGLMGLAPAVSAAEPFGRLTLAEVNQKRTQKNVYVYDDNPKELYASGHIPGAKWLDPESVKASDLPTDKTATLIFYCMNPH